MAREQMTHAQTVRWAWIGGIGLALVAVLIVVSVAVGGTSDRDRADDPQTQAMGAKLTCQDWVRDKLKAPSTAVFSGVSTTGSGPWTVTGNVDAENSFGATIRSAWSCDIRLDGDTFRGRASLHE